MQKQSLSEVLVRFPKNQAIQEMVFKTLDHIENEAMRNGKIKVSISGGSDSDIMIDLFERIGYPDGLVDYVWFDTGLEYDATKRHIKGLEEKYGVQIIRKRPRLTVAQAVKRFGVPFLEKKASGYIERLEKHNFQFEDLSFNELYQRYPNCKAALRFWCNEWGDKSSFNIKKDAGLKEFMIKNKPPQISDKCCTYAKKKVAEDTIKEIGCTLDVVGVRRAEGGGKSNSLHVLLL